MNRTLTLSLVIFFAIVSQATAQGHIVITPIVETGTISRTFTYNDPNSGYKQSGTKSSTTQKGFSLEFLGDKGKLKTKMRFVMGSVSTPRRTNVFTDGLTYDEQYNNATNAIVTYQGRSRALELSEEYTRGFMTYRAGVTYRLLQHTDFQTTYIGDGSSSQYTESEFADNYIGPTFGVTASPSYRRFKLNASIDVAPWLRHGGAYEFRQQNWGTSNYQGKTSSRSLDLDLGGIVRLVKNLGLTVGWRRSSIHTADANFYLSNPYGGKTPQQDRWSGIYIGVVTRF